MKRLVLVAAACVTLVACDYTMHEGGAVPPGCCTPPDTLNVEMHQYGDPAQRCANMGGIYSGTTCWDVDY